MHESNSSDRLKRREFVGLAARAAAVAPVAGLAACAPEGEGGGPAIQARRRVTWRLASSFPRGLDTIYGGAEILARRLEAMSGGYFRIRPHPAGELVPGLQVMDAVQQGSVQLGHTASYYFVGKNPALAFDTGVPFGLTARQQYAWLYYGGGLDLVRNLFADFNIMVFPGGNTGAQMGGWFRRPVESARDLRGLRMRIPGLGGEVMSRLGVTVQVLAGGDIYPALERGVIDATEWVGPYDDEKLGFHQVAQNYYYPGWWEPGPGLSFYVNTRAWESLPVEFKEMFQTAAAQAAIEMPAKYDSLNPAAMERLREADVRFRPFPESILEAAHTAAFELYEEQAAADPAYRRIYEPWKEWRDRAYRWFDTAERAYADFAFPKG